jgi:hypothetical protein
MTSADAKTDASGKSQFRHWHSLSNGFMVSLLIVGPSFLFEELWRGRPLIDQPGKLWIVPGVIMAIGFFVGGSIGGRHRRHAGGAFNQGLVIAGLTLALIFMADMIRRGILHAPLNLTIIGVWCACAAGGLLVSGLGGVSARRRRRKQRYRAQVERVV